MSVRDPDGKLYDEDHSPVNEAVPSGAQAAASALLETVARERGLDVRRLDDEIVLCSDGERRALFRGLTSSSSGKLAHVLSNNDAWLRSHLARHGLPVIPTSLVGVNDARFAQRTAEALGFPVRVRLAGVPDEVLDRSVTDVASLHEVWRAVVQAAPDQRSQVILEHRPSGPEVEVAVVAHEVMACSVTEDAMDLDPVRSLAQRVVATVPNVSNAWVSIVAASPDLAVDRLSVWLPRSVDLSRVQSRAVVAAVLDRDQAGGR